MSIKAIINVGSKLVGTHLVLVMYDLTWCWEVLYNRTLIIQNSLDDIAVDSKLMGIIHVV